MGGIAVRFQPQDAQGWIFGIQIPGRVEGGDCLDLVSLHLHAAVTQGKNAKDRGIAQGNGQVGIVKGQVGKSG